MFPDHLRRGAKLFRAREAEGAFPAGDQIMHANTIAGRKPTNVWADLLHKASDFMPKGQRQ
jgi:hypothetical protein